MHYLGVIHIRLVFFLWFGTVWKFYSSLIIFRLNICFAEELTLCILLSACYNIVHMVSLRPWFEDKPSSLLIKVSTAYT